jgi:hypothetical protein
MAGAWIYRRLLEWLQFCLHLLAQSNWADVWCCDFSFPISSITTLCTHACWKSTWSSNVSTSSCRTASRGYSQNPTELVWSWSTNWLQPGLKFVSCRGCWQNRKVLKAGYNYSLSLTQELAQCFGRKHSDPGQGKLLHKSAALVSYLVALFLNTVAQILSNLCQIFLRNCS